MCAETAPLGAHPVEVRGLGKEFRLGWKRGKVCALENLSLVVRRGEVFGLLGPNGSGKSTTLKILLGLIRPSGGHATIFGLPAGDREARQRIGYLPESPQFYKFLTGRETLHFFGRLCGLGGRALRDRAESLLALVGLERGGGDRPLAGYSKGMLQRIGLAQAMMHEPELLFLDEPTAGVDPVGAREIKDLVLRIKGEGRTVVLCSHLLDQVEEVCDRVAILHGGHKILEGAIGDLLVSGGGVEARVPEGDPEAVARALESAGFSGAEARKPRRTLESLFIETVTGGRGGAR